MGLAVADVEQTAAVDQHAVRPCERAPARLGLGAVAPLSGAEHGPDHARPRSIARMTWFSVSAMYRRLRDQAKPFGPAILASRAGPPSPV